MMTRFTQLYDDVKEHKSQNAGKLQSVSYSQN